jgi:regulatory protein
MPGTAKDRALGLLAVRWRSREELRGRLARAGFDPGEIDEALADLELVGLVEDARFARELVQDQAGRRLSGDRAILAALRQRGVSPDVAEAAMGAAGDQAARARSLAERRATRLAGLPPEAAFRRLYGALVRRGYPPDMARDACRAALAGLGGPDTLLEDGPEQVLQPGPSRRRLKSRG